MSEQKDQNQMRWEALMRANILSTTTHKLFGYITLADSKAAGLIVMNSIIVPLALSGFDDKNFKLAATIAVITCVCSMLFAILCIFPQRGIPQASQGKRKINLLHFNDIGHMSQKEFLEIMNPIYNNPPELAQTVLKDIHDISKRVLIPKFRLLKTAYSIFFLGNLIAISLVLFNMWS